VRLSLILVAALAALVGCDREANTTSGIITAECTPMPAECPATLACEVTTTVEDGEEVRTCGGTACCQSFCELNGCGKCCGPAPGVTAAAQARAAAR
jgi:hypothetical protein